MYLLDFIRVVFGFSDIEVIRMATIADLKQAVEAAFGHMPKKGPGKVSWYAIYRLVKK